MDISVTLNFEESDNNELAAILNCNKSEVPVAVKKLADAAIQEYLTMIRGQKVFKRGTDILEYRLLLLIQYHFNGIIPDEREVSALFQTTLTESRSLIRAVISKYQYHLKETVKNTMRKILETIEEATDTSPYEVIINSQNIVDELNKLIAEIDGTLPSVTKKRSCVSTYDIPRSSYTKLIEKLNPHE